MYPAYGIILSLEISESELELELWKKWKIYLPGNFANNITVFDVEHFVRIETSIVNIVIVSFREQDELTLFVCLLRHYTMHDGNVLTSQFVYHDIAVYDRSVFVQE